MYVCKETAQGQEKNHQKEVGRKINGDNMWLQIICVPISQGGKTS